MDRLDLVTENELKIFSEINHDNIVRYYDHFHMSIEGEDKTFLITEYCEVSRFSKINHLDNYL
jgi:serine/threonine protein kinase